jgi:chorismate mutase/prephenate dehydratase
MMNDSRPSSSAALPNQDAELDRLRLEIDTVDREILACLNRRAQLVKAIGEAKRRAGRPVYAAARERDLVARLAVENPGPFPSAGLPHVFREIISATRSLEETLRVAYFGPEGTFTHLAARTTFGALAELKSVDSIAEVFAAVERGHAEAGVVPIENSTEGVVTQTLDAFVESDLVVCGETVLRISHDLMSRSGRLEDVRRVASHPQPLAQCRIWLDRNLPGIPRVEAASTVSAARLAAESPDVAAIGSSLAGEACGLRTIQSSIEDRTDNTTRFVVIGREAPPPSGNDLTSVIFTVRRNEAGALFRLLEPFARHGVNLASIQSRPIKGKPWEYLFFIDVEGHLREPAVAAALAEAAERSYAHHVLGSFPRALPLRSLRDERSA